MTEKKQTKPTKSKRSPGRMVLPVLIILFFLPGILIFGWYGLTYLPVQQTSAFPSSSITVSSGGQQCTLEIPAGTLSLKHPRRAALGSTYAASAKVSLERAFRFSDCSSGMSNWNINLEAQTSFVGANVQPFASIRQPAVNREQFSFDWTLTPEEAVASYQSHLWLRVIVSQQDQTIERWNILVRDYPMENAALFGQPTILWLIIGGFTTLVAVLLLILRLQKKP